MIDVSVGQPLQVAVAAFVGVVCLALAARTWLVYDTRGVGSFSALLALVGFWSFNFAAKFALPTLGVQLVAARVDFAMTLLIPLLWFSFATAYVGANDRLSSLITELGGLVVFGATLAVVYVPEQVIWTDLSIVSAPFPHYEVVASPIYIGFAAVAFLLFLAGLVRLFEAMLTTQKASFSIVTLMLGTAIPLFLNTEYLLGLGLFTVNYTAIGYGAFMIISAVTVFSNLFTVNPIARRTILANVTDGVLVLDHKHRIADYNDRIVESFTPAVDDLVGADFATAFPDIAAEVTLEDDAECIVERSGPAGETYYRIVSTRIDNGQATVGWNVVATDVTALKRQQAELRRQNEQLDQFASTVSHDLRNPLNVISGSAEVLSFTVADGREQSPADGYATIDAETAVDRIESIETATDRMEAIIDDLLTLAREGQSVEEQSEVSVEAVAEDAWDVIDSKNATLETDADGTIVANRSRLQTILENLFRNAIDHVGPDVGLAVTLSGDQLAIVDDGPGIPESEREQVFEFGYTTAEEGSGLGLAIVSTMAEAHGWDVAIDFEYDEGTRVVFSGLTRELAGDDAGVSAEFVAES